MSIIRLFHPENITESTTSLLSKEHAHYIVNVMRLKRGSIIYFFNKQGEWESEIIFLDKNRVEVKFLKKIKDTEEEKKGFELAICLVKKNSMDIILQKSTELGVDKIIPIISERTEVKEINLDRSKKIVTEATEQSNQLSIPEIKKPQKLKDFLSQLDDKTTLFFADINCKKKIDMKTLIKTKKICILIGPEGDFSPGEREIIESKKNIISFSLSKNILRTETAVITAASLVNYFLNL